MSDASRHAHPGNNLIQVILDNENYYTNALLLLICVVNFVAARSLGLSDASRHASATKWLPKWLGCEPRLIVVSLDS